jgi:concentrative nucleoside transporter, CNT family
MERFTGLLGFALIIGVAFLLSNNRKAINYRTVGVGLGLQFILYLGYARYSDLFFFLW